MSTRQVVTTLEYVLSTRSDRSVQTYNPETTFVSEGQYESARLKLTKAEAQILHILGYQTHVALPYTLCINYLQTLDTVTSTTGHDLAKRAFAHLNAALLSPQLVYLTHQPNAIATAAIYLSAKEIGVKLPEVEWWEVFDVDREELGFLVVALTSMLGFAEQEAEIWTDRSVPLTVSELQNELEWRKTRDDND